MSIQNDIARYIADFQNQIVELEAAKAAAPQGWVVKVGPLWIKFDAAYKNPRAVGAGHASVLRTGGEAYRLAKYVQNGGGQRGEVQTREVALDEQIASLKASIEFLSQQSA